MTRRHGSTIVVHAVGWVLLLAIIVLSVMAVCTAAGYSATKPNAGSSAALAATTTRPTTPAAGGRIDPPCTTVVQCRRDLAWARKDRAHLHLLLLRRTRSDLHHAIALASALFGVSAREMTCIAWAESGYGRQTTPEPSSGALGPFQWLSSSWATTPLGRAGYARTDFLAASLATAQRVVIDGGWREWVTGPGCGL